MRMQHVTPTPIDDITKSHFERFVKVQMEGSHNMLSEGAIRATGLTPENFMGVLTNYDELDKKFPGVAD